MQPLAARLQLRPFLATAILYYQAQCSHLAAHACINAEVRCSAGLRANACQPARPPSCFPHRQISAPPPVPQGPLVVYCAHLEVFCGMLARIYQLADIFEDCRRMVERVGGRAGGRAGSCGCDCGGCRMLLLFSHL